MVPFEGYRISSPYGMRKDPFDGSQKMHTGIDLVIADKAPIKAFMAGKVTHARMGVTSSGFGNFGNVVAIRDVNGALHCYAHLHTIAVKLGDNVKVGQVIGTQGNTGRSAGSHLHYEVRLGATPSFGFGTHTNPTTYLAKWLAPYAPQIIKERIVAVNAKLKYIPLSTGKPYAIKATDVRFLKLDPNKVRFEFVYEKGAKVSELVKKYGADLGFNGPFFHNGMPLGDIEDHGVDVPHTGAYGKLLKWHEFGVLNGIPQIGQLDKNAAAWDLLIQGSPLLVNNSRGVWDWYKKIEDTATAITTGNKQRTFIGIDAAGNFMLAIADGRTGSDQGLTLDEMGLYMLDKGAVTALNLDGGGSTILANRSGGINQAENVGKFEREVNHAILVFYK